MALFVIPQSTSAKVEYRALLIKHGALLIDYKALLTHYMALFVIPQAMRAKVEYRALLIKHWALLIDYKALLTYHLALCVIPQATSAKVAVPEITLPRICSAHAYITQRTTSHYIPNARAHFITISRKRAPQFMASLRKDKYNFLFYFWICTYICIHQTHQAFVFATNSVP